MARREKNRVLVQILLPATNSLSRRPTNRSSTQNKLGFNNSRDLIGVSFVILKAQSNSIIVYDLQIL